MRTVGAIALLGAASYLLSMQLAATVVAAAAVVVRRGQTCRMARLALGGVASQPIRLPEAEAILINQSFQEDLLSKTSQVVSMASNPSDDFHASAVYRRAMATVVAERALRDAWEQVENR